MKNLGKKLKASLTITILIIFTTAPSLVLSYDSEVVVKATKETLKSDQSVWSEGTLESINNSNVTIDGKNYKIRQDISYIDKNGQSTNAGAFVSGSTVIYFLAPDRENIFGLVNGSSEEAVRP